MRPENHYAMLNVEGDGKEASAGRSAPSAVSGGVDAYQIMRIPWKEIPRLLVSPVGRIRLRRGAFGRASVVLLPLAALYRRTLIRQVCVVSVVGSYGKTTTTRAVAAMFGLPLQRYNGQNAGSFLASAVLHTRPWMPNVVHEVGITRQDQMRRYARVVRPDLVVATSIGVSHHLSLNTLETTRDEKCEMVRSLKASGAAILNADDPNVLWMSTQTAARVITFGFSESSDIRATDVRLSRSGTSFVLHVAGEKHPVCLSLIGRHMVYPALAAVAVASAMGISVQSTITALEGLPAMSLRMESVLLPSGALLLDDTYKSDIETIDVGLEALRAIPALRRIAVLGEITEPPRPQGPYYVQMGEQAAGIADHLIYAGGKKGFSSVRSGARRGGMAESAIEHAHHGSKDAADALSSTLRDGDVVLIKGRRVQHLERVALILRGEAVTCNLRFCRMSISCVTCPNLGKARQRFC
ncbi:Mur ligase family protein [Candidatus Bipolaricaulota bacterium]